jgi:catechol 2,3-dioxygenase-like lactoylglutathione lyase family enzyme
MNTATYAIELRSARRQPSASVVHLSVRCLLRSINFFSSVLGLEVVRDGRREACPHVVMTARGCSQVVLYASRSPARARDAEPSGPMIVADLDQARAKIWDAGLRVTREGTREWIAATESRRLWVRDPDGHELELVAAAR